MDVDQLDVDGDGGIRAWQCSVCAKVQPVECDPCTCGHPRDQAPESADVIIPGWHPNEGELVVDMKDDGDDEVEMQPEGEAPAAVEYDDRVGAEGEIAPANDDSDGSWDSDGDWDGMEEADIIPRMSPPVPEEKREPPKGWMCGLCGAQNTLMDLQCVECGKYRNMHDGEGNDDQLLLRVEVTAGVRPNLPPPEEKDINHEVWTCPGCNSYNDYIAFDLQCWRCKHVIDSTHETFFSYMISHAEYEEYIGKPRRKARGEDQPADAAGNGGNGGVGGVGGGGGGARGRFGGGGAGGGRRNNPSERRAAINLRQRDKNDFVVHPNIVRKHRPLSEYPSQSDLAFSEPNRLGQELGRPQQLPCAGMPLSFWRKQTLAYPCMKIRGVETETNRFGPGGLYGRGFDVNEEGNLAFLTPTTLRVYRPRGPSFELVVQCPFDSQTSPSDHSIRLRYRRNMVYIFCEYVIARFDVDIRAGTIQRVAEFKDGYMKEQKFKDIDVRDNYIVATWRKWAGMYNENNFSWFHAVSTTTGVMIPHSLVFKHAYLHVSMGSCLLAFHTASRDPTVLWIYGNLPDNTPFCVSTRYGVFASVHGDIVQSYYEATQAQPIHGDQCLAPNGQNPVAPIPTDREFANRYHQLLNRGNPFANVSHIEYDESFGEHGRLLCWDKESQILFMALNGAEFDVLRCEFCDVFGNYVNADKEMGDAAVEVDDDGSNAVEAKNAEDGVLPFAFLDFDGIRALEVGMLVDYRCSDGRFRVATVRACGTNGLIVLGFEESGDVVRVEKSDTCIAKFAMVGNVSGRTGARLQDLDVGDEVDVNLENMGWTVATVLEFDDVRGQVAVQLGNGELKWTHLDFENEIRQRQELVAEAVEYDQDMSGDSENRPTSGGPNLIEDISEDERERIEKAYVKFSNNYSEPVVKWFLESYGFSVESSPTGLSVSMSS